MHLNSCKFYSVVVLAANIAPVDVISHIPVLCEEKGIPYVFVSSKVCIHSFDD